MDGKPFAFAGLAILLIFAFRNPLAWDWWSNANFAVAGWAWHLSLYSMLAISLPLMILALQSLWFLINNRLRGVFLLFAVGFYLAVWIFLAESRGMVILSDASLMYVLTVIYLCLAIATAIGVKEAKPAQ